MVWVTMERLIRAQRRDRGIDFPRQDVVVLTVMLCVCISVVDGKKRVSDIIGW
jgi:hypothetical protein